MVEIEDPHVGQTMEMGGFAGGGDPGAGGSASGPGEGGSAGRGSPGGDQVADATASPEGRADVAAIARAARAVRSRRSARRLKREPTAAIPPATIAMPTSR